MLRTSTPTNLTQLKILELAQIQAVETPHPMEILYLGQVIGIQIVR